MAWVAWEKPVTQDQQVVGLNPSPGSHLLPPHLSLRMVDTESSPLDVMTNRGASIVP